MAELPTFDEVYRLYAPDVYRLCLFQLRDAAAAEDVTADVFVSALASYERSAPKIESLRFWLMRIAKNAVIDRRRREGLWHGIAATLRREQQPTADVERLAGLHDDVATVLKAMSQMRKRDQLLISLRTAADLSFEEIGRLTGMSAKSASMATYRAMERLRERLGEWADE